MDSAQITVTLSGLVLIAATLWFFFGGREEAAPLTSKGPIYACPMHPWITSTDPTAECSICGMKLVRAEPGHSDPTSQPNATDRDATHH